MSAYRVILSIYMLYWYTLKIRYIVGKQKGRVRKDNLLRYTQSIQELLNLQLGNYRENKILTLPQDTEKLLAHW